MLVPLQLYLADRDGLPSHFKSRLGLQFGVYPGCLGICAGFNAVASTQSDHVTMHSLLHELPHQPHKAVKDGIEVLLLEFCCPLPWTVEFGCQASTGDLVQVENQNKMKHIRINHRTT